MALNRPEIRNAFNDEMIAELTEVFTTLGADDNVRHRLAATIKPFCAKC